MRESRSAPSIGKKGVELSCHGRSPLRGLLGKKVRGGVVSCNLFRAEEEEEEEGADEGRRDLFLREVGCVSLVVGGVPSCTADLVLDFFFFFINDWMLLVGEMCLT